MRLLTLLAGLAIACTATAASSKKCQSFTLTSKATACMNDFGGCVVGKCVDKVLWLECTCPDDHPHVKCSADC